MGLDPFMGLVCDSRGIYATGWGSILPKKGVANVIRKFFKNSG
jgi:hypothetical protein